MNEESLKESPLEIKTSALGGHGHDNRGFETGGIPGGGYGRFGRMFNIMGRPIADAVLWDIAGSMIKDDVSKPIGISEDADENRSIPAGYTYFGQFVDHDITFDPAPISVDRIDVAALVDFRTPALDLDCLYGRGPDDQPYMYHADSKRLREGVPLTNGSSGVRDLPRVAAAEGDDELYARALIGDKRNDENRIVAQFHALMIRLHNKIVTDRKIIEEYGGDFKDANSCFRTAVNVVRWHYQWLIVHDFLDRRILKPGTVAAMLGDDGTPKLRFYDKVAATYAYMPVEFAGAAYRFGHSIVRPGYSLSRHADHGDPIPDIKEQDGRIPIFSNAVRREVNPRESLNGFGIRIPEDWGIDWDFFFQIMPSEDRPSDLRIPQPSYRLDTMLVFPLTNLPEFRKEENVWLRALAYRNLRRGTNVLALPSGEQVAKAIGAERVLTPEEVWQGYGAGPLPSDFPDREPIEATIARRSAIWSSAKEQLNGNTPLWYYVLREAELLGVEGAADDPMSFLGGHHLGPVGSAIVAETFLGLLWRDDKSYLRRWPRFQPTLGKRPGQGEADRYELADLIHFVLRSDETAGPLPTAETEGPGVPPGDHGA